MARSFALRLAVAFAAVGVGAAAVTALLVNVAFGTHFTEYLEQRQEERRAQLVASLEEIYTQSGGWDLAALQRTAGAALMDGGTLVLEDPDGGLIWEAPAEPDADVHRLMMGTGPLGEERRWPVRAGGQTVAVAVMALPQPGLLPWDIAFQASVNRNVLLGASLAGLAALLVGAALARRITAPARALTAGARAVAAGERSVQVPADRADEFGEMAAAFNHMAEAVETQDRLRREFAADVAHELRTPLMILRGEIEALQDGIVEPTPHAVESLREETLRLGRLIEDLETLTQADAAGFSLAKRPTDLLAILTEATQDLAPVFADRSIRVDSDARQGVVVTVDPGRIKQVVANLLSNAAKFTPEGGRARLTLAHEPGAAVITVWNSGEGIAAGDLAHVFDRFYRGRRPRSGGSGIGLTVARELVEAHGGTIDVSSNPQDGTAFRVVLPGATRAAVASMAAR